MKDLQPLIQQKLEEKGADHEFIPLPPDLPLDVASHVAFHGISLKQAVPTLIFNTEKGLVAVQKRADCDIASKKLKQVLGVQRLSFATPEQIEELGLLAGAVPLSGLEMSYFMDEAIFDNEEIYGGGGHKDMALKIKPHILQQVNQATVASYTQPHNQTDLHARRVLSGINPSGDSLHIGNYFGVVKPQIELLDQVDQAYYFMADLHALTSIHDQEQLEKNITAVVLDYLALGLDPDRAIFFRQSQVPAHSQLAVVLGNFISYGQMQRMHAFKDKLQKDADVGSINMGLFNYPILMAADILLYKPYGVPVGEDQRQHVELTRDIAENFNKAYGSEVFPLPEPLIRKETGKIIGTDGQRKMSKSLGNIVSIFGDEALIRKQIMGSYTDPNRKSASDRGNVEGNPIFMYHDLINDDLAEVEDLKTRYRAGQVGDVEVKEKLIMAHQRKFGAARQRRQELEQDLSIVKEILANGATKASEFANQTVAEVYEAMGIVNQLN